MARTPLVARPEETILREDLVELRRSLARAESERETWRASGNMEKHLEACSAAAALELRLDRLEKALRESAGELAEPGAPAITFNGRQYCYGPYRYDRLADAESYAKLLGARPGGAAAELGPAQAPAVIEQPGAKEHEQMSALGITFALGVYHLGPYRYDRLADAAAFARLRALRSP